MQLRKIKPEVKILSFTSQPLKAFWIATRNCYYDGKLNDLSNTFETEKAIELYKKITRMGHDSCLEHINFQISFEGVSRSFMAQLTRHRHATYHISSQHFQNHSDYLYVEPKFNNPKNNILFAELMEHTNDVYKQIIENGDKHYVARQVLPNATSCKIIMTVNLRELRHIIKLRQGMENTPETQDVIILLRTALTNLDPIFLWGLP